MPLVPPTKVFIKAFGGGGASSLGQCSSLGGLPPGHLPQLTIAPASPIHDCTRAALNGVPR